MPVVALARDDDEQFVAGMITALALLMDPPDGPGVTDLNVYLMTGWAHLKNRLPMGGTDA